MLVSKLRLITNFGKLHLNTRGQARLLNVLQVWKSKHGVPIVQLPEKSYDLLRNCTWHRKGALFTSRTVTRSASSSDKHLRVTFQISAETLVALSSYKASVIFLELKPTLETANKL
jgi:hypothetical protein